VIVIVVKQHVKPEYAHDWLDRVGPFTFATREEPGNISFDWYRSPDDPNLWLLVEVFRDEEAGRAHVESAHFKAAIAALPSWLAGAPEIIHVNGPSEGWTKMGELSD
jgi:quinol monooxygenase YgiN